MSLNILKIIEELNKNLELEEAKIGTWKVQFRKDKKSNRIVKSKRKTCAKGMQWSSERNACVKMSAKRKIGNAKAGRKRSRTLTNMYKSSSKKNAKSRVTKKTMKFRNSSMSKKKKES